MGPDLGGRDTDLFRGDSGLTRITPTSIRTTLMFLRAVSISPRTPPTVPWDDSDLDPGHADRNWKHSDLFSED
jgi:hypothetical protein